MKDKTILLIIAILCITFLEAFAMYVLRIDGMLLSGTVGAIVYVATSKYYKMRYLEKKEE